MTNKWVVEVYKSHVYKSRRVFSTREKAIDYINDRQDDGWEAPVYQMQIITPEGKIEQVGINGHNR